MALESIAGMARATSLFNIRSIQGCSWPSQEASGVAKPILSLRFRISSGTTPCIARRKTAFEMPFRLMRQSSGSENTNWTRAGVRNGTRLSIEKAMELRSS